MGVMEVKGWVAGRREEIVVQAADDVMAEGMQTWEAQGFIKIAKCGRVADSVADELIIEIGTAPVRVDVTSQAARVVVEASPISNESRQRTTGVDGTEVDGHVGKGTTLNAASAGRSRNGRFETSPWDRVGVIFLRNGFSIAREGVGGAIKEGGASLIVRIFGPIPISRQKINKSDGIEQHALTADIICSHIHCEEPVQTPR